MNILRFKPKECWSPPIGGINQNQFKSLIEGIGVARKSDRERIDDLLTPEMKKHIEEFLKARGLPDKLSDEFVQAIREALSDLKKVTIKVPDLKDALLAGGSL